MGNTGNFVATQGYLVITDITGYTAFLSASELEHAQSILGSLLELLIEHTRSPLVVNKLEGDAIFSYAPQGSFHQGQSLIETFETTYVAFRQALSLMALNTTCTCNACRNIPNLDLKFFVHYGAFIIQKLGGYSELTGADVTLIHRLLKNSIIEKTGIKAYAAYTRAAIDLLGIPEIELTMHPLSETYESLGEVALLVQDMGGVWEREQEKVRLFVKPEEAIVMVNEFFPLPQSLLWDYITTPEFRAILMEAKSNHLTGLSQGRAGPGAVYHCDHGNRISEQTVLDWQPFEQYTTRDGIPYLNTTLKSTYRLKSVEGGTQLTIYWSSCLGSSLRNKVSNAILSKIGPGMLKHGFPKLHQRIEQDLADGKSVIPPTVEVSLDQLSQAVQTSLRPNLDSTP